MAVIGRRKLRIDCLLCVESDGSKNLEPDIPASRTDSLFSKPAQSGMAEEQPVVAIALTVSKVS
jgi:hypothetical protein